jgi:pimeloyl-ACP methyl ester carboxylesterase
MFLRTLGALALVMGLAATAQAKVEPFPAGFHTEEIATNGTTLHVRVGGQGPAVVMLHGFGDTGDMWAPLARDLARNHTVIVPDLRGMGLSAHPAGGYTKLNQAADIAGLLDALHVQKTDLVLHDIGNMVGYAFNLRYPARVRRTVLMDAPLPGLGDWTELSHSPRVWHWYFHGPDEERLVAGRERIFLDRFWNELSADPAAIDEPTRQHYAALYARPGAMHSAFEQFAAFSQDAKDNPPLVAANGKLETPVLAIGGDYSYGAGMARVAEAAYAHVQSKVIANSGHWIMDEQPEAAVAAIDAFLNAPD